MSSSPTARQVHFRIRTDTGGVDATPTWAAAEDTAVSLAVETTFRIRFCCDNTGTASTTSPTILRVSKNSGAYTAVTTSSGATLGAQSADAGSDADGATLNTYRLTAGAGSVTFTPLSYDENGSAAVVLSFGQYIELEYGLILKTAGAAAGNTLDFRLYNSTTAFTTYTQTPRVTVVSNEKNLLANDVLSASSVTKPVVRQLRDDLLANDVLSTSKVTNPALKALHSLLANDVTSASSVGKPALVQIVPPVVLLANDVLSASSVSQPAATILRGLLANDVKSNSTVGQPTVKQLQGLLANDVKSNSSVGQPAAIIGRDLLANDVTSGSTVSNPALTEIAGATALQANDVLSASSVSQPAALIRRDLLANDVASASSVTVPAVHQAQALQANDIVSASLVSVPLFGEIAAGSLLADNVTSASSVSQPGLHLLQDLLAENVISASFVSQPMVDRPDVEVPPEVAGGGKAYGRGFPRKRWEELLAALEAERQAALQRANAFRGSKDRRQAKKAARQASEAIAAALQAADEAAEVARAGTITRSLEAAAEAKGIAEYMKAMQAARAEAEEWDDEDEVETLLLVA